VSLSVGTIGWSERGSALLCVCYFAEKNKGESALNEVKSDEKRPSAERVVLKCSN
jgi:hypothetical protein